jgi:non-ribosomal peptide synthetase component E (peptide arylation enzyme)
MLQLISRAAFFAENISVVSCNQQYTYKELLSKSESIAGGRKA